MKNPVRFIALRYLFNLRGGYSFVNINTAVSVVGITFGVAAVIIVLSVFNGFQKMTMDALTDENPHLIVYNVNYQQSQSIFDAPSIKQLTSQPIVMSKIHKMVSQNEQGFQAIEVKTIYIEDKNSFANDFPDFQEIEYDAIYGKMSSNIEFFNTSQALSIASLSEIENFALSSIPPHFQEYKLIESYSNIVREGVLLRFEKIHNLQCGAVFSLEFYWELDPSVVELVESYSLQYDTWESLNTDIISILKLEKLFASFVMFMIVCIGLFNLLAAISMLLSIKKIDFFTLGVLGLNNHSKKKIVYYYGMTVVTIGLILGLTLGVGLVLAQIHYGIIPISVEGALVSQLPMELELIQVIITTVCVISLSLLLLIIPSSQISNSNYNRL